MSPNTPESEPDNHIEPDKKAEAESILRYGDEQYDEGLQDGWRQAILVLEELADGSQFREGMGGEAVTIRDAFIQVAGQMRETGPKVRP